MNLFKTTTDVLKESAKLTTDNNWATVSESAMLGTLSNIIDLDYSFDYIEDMIPTVLDEETGTLYMEYDNVVKLMESKEVDLVSAMKSICEHYGKDYENSVLVMESKKNIIKRLKDADDETKAKVVGNLKDIKDKGVKVACKKGKDDKSK